MKIADAQARQRARDRAADGVATREEVIITGCARETFAPATPGIGKSPTERKRLYRARLRTQRAAVGPVAPEPIR